MLTTAPVVIYPFEDSPTGTTVEDTSPENSDNDGIFRGDPAGAPNADPTADDPTLFPKFMPASGAGADSPSPAGGQFMRFTGDNAFNGQGGRVQTQDYLGGVDATNDIQGPMDKSASLSFWIRTTAVGTGASWQWPGVTGAEHQGDGNDVFWGIQTTTGQSAVVSGDATPATTINPINDGSWHLITQTRDMATGKVTTYLNGVIQQVQTNDTAEKGADFRSIGAVANINSLRREDGFAHLNADLDQVQIYDRALDFLEVARLFGPASTAVPAVPAPVGGTSGGPALNTITFGSSPGALGYVIYRSDSATGTFSQIGVVGDTATSFNDRNTGPGQVHFYQVKAYNSSGLSAASQTVQVTTAASGAGARGSYFNDAFWGGGGRSSVQRGTGGIATFRPTIPDVTNFVSQVNFDWGTSSPVPGVIRGDHHSTLFTGKITIPADANGDGTNGGSIDVTFVNSSDDDGIIFVNGVEAAQDMGPPGHGQQDRPGSPITLTEGQSYNFSVWQAEQGGGSGVRMKWLNPATGATEVIPDSMFTTAMDTPGTPTLSAPVLSDPADADPLLARQRMVKFTVTENAANHASELWFELYRDGVLVATSPMNSTDADSDDTNGIQTSITDAQPTPGAHNYQIRAVNYDGASALSGNTAVTVPATFTTANGASAYYFNNGAWNGGELFDAGWGGGQDRRTPGTPDFHEVVPTVDIDYGSTANSPVAGVIEDDYFSTVHTGKVLIPLDFNGNGTNGETIPVQFVGNTDDHGIYYVNGQLAAISYIPRGQGDYTGAPPLNLVEGQKYDFVILQVEQEGGAGVHFKWQNPANANAVEVIPTEDLTPTTGAPLAPTGVTGAGLGNVVVLNFTDAATNEVRYDIERSTAAAGPFTKVGSASINATSFADTTVSPGTNYFYRVTAVNYEGQGSTTTGAINSGVVGIPTAPVILSGVARRNGPRIGFRDNSLNESSFIVQRRLASEADSAFADVGTVAATAPGTQGSTLYFQDTTGAVGASYVYRVIARNAAGDGTSANFALTNTVAAGTGLQEMVFGAYLGSRQAIQDAIDAESGITLKERAPAAETFGGGPVGPAGLDSGGGGLGPVGTNAADDTPVNLAADNFAVLLTGYFIPDVTGPYTFQSNSDDGVSMEVIDAGPNGTFGDVDDVHLVDFNGQNFLRGMGAGFADTNPVVNLTAGKAYQLRLSMTEQGGGAGYRFGYFNPTTGLEAIPTELLYPTLPSSSISEVYVRGSTWAPAFKTYMAGQGLGDANLGYRVDNKPTTDIAPWINIDEIVLRFSAPPTGGGIPTPGSVILDGVRSDYTVASVNQIDAQTFALRLDRPLGNLPTPPGGDNGDRIKLTVNGAGPGGAAYTRTINVLQGDVDMSGSVVAKDFSDVKKKFFKSTTNPGAGDTGYTVFHDVDGNGSIVANDFSEVKKRFFDSLPAAPAGASGAAVASVTRDLFSTRSVLG